MFCDKAKAIAPRSPANHITTCILIGIFCRRQRFAKNDNGKMFATRAIKQKTMHKKKNKKFTCFNSVPVNKPIPIYKNTKYSLRTANDLKMLCAVTCDVADKLWLL